MYCKKCGTENPDGAMYCRSCGYELAPARRNASGASSMRARDDDRYDRTEGADYGAPPAPSYARENRGYADRSRARSAEPDDLYKPLSTWAYYGLSLLYGMSVINIFTILTLVAFYAQGGGRALAQGYSYYGLDSSVNGALAALTGSIALLWIISIIGFVGFVMMIIFSCGAVKNMALIKFSRGSLLKWITVVIFIIIWIIITAARARSW